MESFVAAKQYEAVARQKKIVSALAKQTRDFLEENQALYNQREFVVTEVTTEVWRRDEQVHDLRTELSLHALYADDASQQPNQEYAGLYQHLSGLVQDTQKHRDVWRISNWKNWLLDQKSIDFDEERENSYDKYDVKLLKEQNLRLNC